MDLALLRTSLIHGSPLQSVAMRFYQRAACVRVVDEIAAGRKRVLLVAPTGAGKTVMFAAIAAGFHAQGKRVLVIVHRREISAQSVKKLRASGIAEVGVHRGKKGTANESAMVQVAAIQALRPGDVDADLVIVDEAQHCPAETWARLLDLYPNAVHIGACLSGCHPKDFVGECRQTCACRRGASNPSGCRVTGASRQGGAPVARSLAAGATAGVGRTGRLRGLPGAGGARACALDATAKANAPVRWGA